MRRLLVLAIFIGMAAAVARWAGSRRRRALDRQPPGSVPVTRMQGQPVTPPEPLDGESVEPVGTPGS